MFKYSGQSCYISCMRWAGPAGAGAGQGPTPAARAALGMRTCNGHCVCPSSTWHWACAPATGIVLEVPCWALAVYSESLDRQATVRFSAETIIEQSNHRN